jgi:regulation of enolase protein 1 (concanavalin A-like superfamily)
VNWINEPAQWSESDGTIFVHAGPQTDFWRVTGYGYVRDNAHIYGEALTSDFDLSVKIRAEYATQYDQAGAAVRIDESHWIKTGVEMFNGRLRFSTVVTIENSSWMLADLPEPFTTLNLALARRGDALEISFSTDDDELALTSIVYLQPKASAFAGVMCAAPDGDGFPAYFSDLVIHAR